MFFCKLNRCCCFGLNVGTVLIGIFDFLFALLSFVRELLYSDKRPTWLTFAIIYSLISLLLILSIRMNKPAYLLPWLLVNFVFLLGMFVVIIQCTKLYILYSPVEKPPTAKKSPDKVLILVLMIFITGTTIIAGLELVVCFLTIVFNSISSYTSVTLIVSSAVYATLCLLVIIGVKTENSNCLLPWIVVTLISIVLMFMGLIFIFVSFFKAPRDYTTIEDQGKMDLTLDFLFLTNLVGLSISIYLWIVVNSCHQELRKPFERACIPTHDLSEQSIPQNLPPVVILSDRVMDSSYPPPYDIDMSVSTWGTGQTPHLSTHAPISESLPYIHFADSSLENKVSS